MIYHKKICTTIAAETNKKQQKLLASVRSLFFPRSLSEIETTWLKKNCLRHKIRIIFSNIPPETKASTFFHFDHPHISAFLRLTHDCEPLTPPWFALEFYIATLSPITRRCRENIPMRLRWASTREQPKKTSNISSLFSALRDPPSHLQPTLLEIFQRVLPAQ